MKTALITTTINVPRVLALYRQYGPNIRFFVAIDQKTPEDAANFCTYDIENTQVVFIGDQEKYKCSALIGWNCIQRRNLALLEALKWGADLIVSIDDDNIPLNKNYFADFQRVLLTSRSELVPPGNIRHTTDAAPFNGLKASSPTSWFDVGQLLYPIAPHRGFPYDKTAQPYFEHTVGARVGVAAGICLGDPDISAVERIAHGPTVHAVSEILRAGVVVDPKQTWTVFNTQNTAFVRELAPAMFCPPGIGRYDDIVASLVTQRVMRERGYHVHFGKPFVWQQRNSHDLVKDLENELWGMRNVVRFAKYLDSVSLRASTALYQCRELIGGLDKLPNSYDLLPDRAKQAALAFYDDTEKVL